MTSNLISRSPIENPGSYPGVPVSVSTLVTRDGLYPMTASFGGWKAEYEGAQVELDEVLSGLGAEPMTARVPVLAIGSNASVAQLRRKFSALASWTVPVTLAEATGIGVAYSAHVSRPGYVPWAPYAAGDDRVATFRLTWLTAAEVEVLDATEPNYSPTQVSPATRVTIETGQRIERVKLYKGRWGVLGDETGIIPAGNQENALSLVTRFFGREVTQADLARDAGLRVAVTEALRAAAHSDGLTPENATMTPRGIESTPEDIKQ